MPVKLQVLMTIPGKEAREFEYEFEDSRISIGRDQDNDIQVPLSTVSRKHCLLYLDNDEWYLEDLKSTHGTRHNGKPVGAGGKKLLRDGDVVELIHFKITFHNPESISADYSSEKTEALARKMVEEVLASIGRDGGEVPYLQVMNGPDEGKRFDVSAEVTEATVGRGNDCDFQVNDANISRRHALVRRDWNEITIEDLGSKNGVVINDRRITRPTPLRDADELLLGAVRLTFIDPSAKFIGKLDDIPAFAMEPTGMADELEERSDEGDGAGDAEDPAVGDDGDDGDDGDERDAWGGAGAGDERPEDSVGGDPGAHRAPIDDDNDVEADPFEPIEDTTAAPPRGLGAFEIALIAGAALAVIGLGVGVAVLVFGS